MLEMQHAGALDEAMGHQCAGRDDGLDPASIDHFTEHETLLGDRHRARDRDYTKAVFVAYHSLERVGRLAETATTEGGVGHGGDQRINRIESADIQGNQRFEPIVVSGSVTSRITLVRHGRILGQGEGVALPALHSCLLGEFRDELFGLVHRK
jgi:hypothetical protein